MVESKKKKRGPGRPPDPQRRARLIEISRKVFSEYGFSGTSMDKVAEAVGLRKPSLFHHFPSKEALYIAVLQLTVLEVARFIAESNLGEGPFATRLDRLGRRRA